MASLSGSKVLGAVYEWILKFLRAGSKHGFRSLVIIIGLIALAVLVYLNVWLPLQEDVSLPSGVSAGAAQIDSALIQRIQAERAERISLPVRVFAAAERIFVQVVEVPAQ